MNGELVDYNPVFDTDYFSAHEIVREHLEDTKDANELRKFNRNYPDQIQYHHSRLSRKYIEQNVKKISELKIFGHDEITRVFDYKYIDQQYDLWLKMNSNGMIKICETPVLWDTKRLCAVPEEYVGMDTNFIFESLEFLEIE